MAGLKGTPAKAGKKSNEPPPPLPPEAGRLTVFYDRSRCSYYTQVNEDIYMRTDKDLLSIRLRNEGYHKKAAASWMLSPLEKEMLRISQEMGVDYAGPIGGYKAGIHRMFNGNVLVTSSPTFLTPKEGEWWTLGTYFEELLGDQKKYLFAWLKWALVSLRKGPPWSPGQAFAIAGPVGCGKSMLQSIITMILGNRTSKPYKYLIGKSDFNGEIFSAEHGIIGDEVPLLDIRSRRNFGSALKNLVVNKEQSIRGLYKDAIVLTPFLRLSISLNDDPESLLCLPPLDSDVKDKLLIVKANTVNFPWPSKKFADSQSYFDRLTRELPAFVHWLLRWPVPNAIRNQRYGVESYHHPDLVRSVDDMAPEWKLWEMVCHHLAESATSRQWRGSALDLERELKQEDRTGEVSRLLAWTSACGQFLAKLALKLPDRVTSTDGGQGRRVWALNIPAKKGEFARK